MKMKKNLNLNKNFKLFIYLRKRHTWIRHLFLERRAFEHLFNDFGVDLVNSDFSIFLLYSFFLPKVILKQGQYFPSYLHLKRAFVFLILQIRVYAWSG